MWNIIINAWLKQRLYELQFRGLGSLGGSGEEIFKATHDQPDVTVGG